MRSTVASIMPASVAGCPGTTGAAVTGFISPGEDHGAVRAEPAAGPAHTGEAGVGHLALAAFTPQLADRLDQQEQPTHARVAGRQASAIGVGRQGTSDSQPPVRHERAPLALGAEAEVLE